MKIFNSKGKCYDEKNLELISKIGSEFFVYKYGNNVVKIYKENYNGKHLSLEKMKYLMSIPTKRILMPNDIVFDKNGNMIGYQMPLVENKKDIKNEKVETILQEIRLLEHDVAMLSDKNVVLIDVGLENTIFNGKINIIDPCNFSVNNFEEVKDYISLEYPNDSEKQVILKWNFSKMNRLCDLLMFTGNANVDCYKHRLISQFFAKERQKLHTYSNRLAYQKYLNSYLSLKDATNVLLNLYIKENEKEKEIFLNLIQ